MTRSWSSASWTGIGPMPGDDVLWATRIAFETCPSLPFVPWLPNAGTVGCDFAGRGAALLVDLHVDLQPSGWRLVPRPGVDERRARDGVRRSLDALEEAAGQWVGPVKVSAPGPWSLGATVELARGEKVLADAGAARDLAGALAEGVAAHVAAVRRAVPAVTDVVVQIDEPLLALVLAGRIKTQSGWSAHPAVDAPVAEELLALVVAAGGAHAGVRVARAGPVPVGVVQRAGAAWLGYDVVADDTGVDLDALGDAVDAGLALFLGVDDPDPAITLWSHLGFAREQLPDTVVVTPPDGLERTAPSAAERALRRAGELADDLAQRSV
ncbi:MAG TPA: hypothetical protein VFK42_04475 [Acidimicrobiales bacterium]|nr:hypothetical protein [Acidimicrobiales bacterium]